MQVLVCWYKANRQLHERRLESGMQLLHTTVYMLIYTPSAYSVQSKSASTHMRNRRHSMMLKTWVSLFMTRPRYPKTSLLSPKHLPDETF